MMRSTIILLTLFSAFVLHNTALAQRGTLVGTIVDASSGDPLINATIVLEGTSRGVVSDLDGNYTMSNIPAGTYTVIISYINFITQNITEVQIQAGEILRLDIAMQPTFSELNELTITAEAVMNNESAMLRHRQRSIGFTDAISAENIARSGSGDAAAAMKKVTGATVVGGKYVFVRGLGDRYTNTQLNGLELPTSDPDKKSFQLDLFPSHLLDNIVTLKTFTPDKPGNFSGGLVDITTRGIPDGFYLSLSVKQGFNTRASMRNILLGESGNRDWLGYDTGYRAEPGSVLNRPTNEFPSATQARFNPAIASELDQIANSFNQTFLPAYRQSGTDQSYSFGLGNRLYLTPKIQFGFSANYSYAMGYRFYDDGRNSRFELLGLFDESESLSPSINLTDVRGSQSVDWGFLGSAGLIIGSANKINFSYLRTQSGENTGRFLFGFWEQFNSEDTEYRSRVNQFVERNLESFQLSGNHTIPALNNTRIDWNSARQSNGQEQPDLRIIASEARFIRNPQTQAITDTLLGNPNSQFPRPARFFRNLDEQKSTATLDITVPFRIGSASLKVKTGALYEYTTRDFRERRYEYLQGRNFSLTQFSSEDDYLRTLGIRGFDSANRAEIGNYVVSATTDRSSYDAEQTIMAQYIMMEFDVTRFLKVSGGVRYEDTFLESVSRDSTLRDDDRIGTIDQQDLLPSLILIGALSETMQLRAAFSRTLARPTFREMSPYVSFDFIGDNLFRGNANLERTLITNYDFRWEWYPGIGEMISASVFYKKLDNPIERVLRFDISQNAESIQNVDRGEVYGIEFEMRKNLGGLSEMLRHFQLMANYAYIQSTVTIPEAEMILIRQTRPDADNTRPLSGQSPFVLNVDLAYYNPDLRLATNVSYNYFGDRLSRVSQGSAPDVFERGSGSLNFNVSQSIGRYLSLSASATNLLDPAIVYSQRFKGKEYLYQRYQTGRTFSLGIKYSF